jgi:gliding motility-associated-like protein
MIPTFYNYKRFLPLLIGCIYILFFTEKSNAQLVCSATKTPSTCTANGSITAVASGGSGSYNYNLSSSTAGCLAQSILQSTPTFSALKPCAYTLTVNDLVSGAQCQMQVLVTGNYVLPNLTLTVTNCKVTANLTGGNNPFIYSYSTVGNSGPFITNTPPTKKTFTGLPAGTVWIQVQDSCGNTFIQQAVIGNSPITGFATTFVGGNLTVTTVTGGNVPYTYKLITASNTITNQTGLFPNAVIDCVTKITVSDSCTSKTSNFNIPVDGTLDCVNFLNGTANVTPTSGVPPFSYQVLVNNVVVGTSTNGQFTGLPTTPAVKKYDIKIIDACNKSKTITIEAFKPVFSGSMNCGPGGNILLQLRRNNNVNSPLFYPVTVSVPTGSPANFTFTSPTTQTNFNNFTGNPNIFTIQNACGDKVICKDSLILTLNSNCVNINAKMEKIITCDNGTGSYGIALAGVVTYQLFDLAGNLLATNTTGNFTAPSPGTYKIVATHPTCGVLEKTITINPGGTQINPNIQVMIRYTVVNGKCVPRYNIKIADTEGPYFIGGANNVSQYLNTASGGFYTATNLPPGNYTVTSTTFCTGVPLNLPTPNYNLTAQVVQSCPGDAQIEATGAYDFAYWQNWFLQNGNLNLVTWNNNGGPHKDFYNTSTSNNYTGWTGSPYTIKNLNAGQNYTIYLMPFDAKETGGGCPVDTVSVVIPPYNQLKVAASRGIICDGATAADIKVWVNPVSTTNKIASGRKPYTYQLVSCTNLTTPIGTPINSSDTLVTFPNLTQGTHCIKVVDKCGVSADYQTQVGPLGAGQYIGINCGQLRLQVDTIPGATYSWKNVTTGQYLGNQYFVLVTTPAAAVNFSCDITIGSCQMVRNITIPAGVGQVNVTVASSAPTTFCQGQNTTLTATSNANTYAWSNGQTGANITVASSGTYTVTATNLLGCTKTAAINIDVVPPISASITPKNVTCFGQNNGQITSQLSTAQNVTYAWSNGGTSPNISNLSPNNYTLTLTDNFGCKTTFNTSITQPLQLTSAAQSTNISCFGNQNGTASVQANGGTAPFQYQWSNNANSLQISNLPQGNYTAIVTDANGCTSQSSVQINEPNPLLLGTNPQNPTVCIGEKIAITAIPQGGNGGFVFQWSNGSNSVTQTLGKGAYSVTVTDSQGCKATSNFNVVETTSVSVPLLNSATICAGTSKNLEVSGNFKTFKWSTGATTSTISISQAQQYCVTVTTQGGCLGDTCINITQVPNPQPLIKGDTLICKEGKTTISVTKNFAQYVWNNAIATQNNLVGVGNYQVTVTDLNGCKGATNYSVLPRKSPNVSISPDKKLCVGDSIKLITKSAGVAFAWDNGKKSSDIFVKNQGKYCVTITDNFGCKNDTCANIAIFQNPIPTISGDSLFCKNEKTTLTCNENFVSYLWSNGEKNKTITTSIPNTYVLKVTDINGCQAEKSFLTKALALPQFDILGDTAFCIGKTITLNLDKNFSNYVWSNGEKTKQITISKGGKYSIEVSDSLGCKNIGEIILKENPLPTPTISGVTAICANASTVLKVNENFVKYEWSNGTQKQDITLSKSGTYNVTVTDKNGCENQAQKTIIDIAKLSPAIVGDAIFCQGEKSELKLNLPFAKYTWSNGQNSAQLTVNQSGNYCVTVNDANGCKGDTCLKIVVNPLPKAAISGKNLVCGKAQTTLLASPPNLDYEWSNGEKNPQITVNAGTYKITFTDTKGCKDTLSKTVIAAPDVSLLAQAVLQDNNMNISCFGLADGKAEVKIKSGTAPYQYVWNTGEKSAFLQNLKAGKYFVTVTDALGCKNMDSVFLQEPPILKVLSSSLPVKCFGEKNGAISIQNVSGGNGEFTYQFDNQPFKKLNTIPFDIKDLAKKNYILTIKDKKGCSVTQNLSVGSPNKYTLTIPSIDTVITNDSVQLKPIYNFQPDSIFWSPKEYLTCFDCLYPFVKPKKFSTLFELWAWKNGCPAYANLQVISRKYRNHDIYIPNVFSPNEDGTNDLFSPMNNPTVARIEKLQIYDRWGELIWEGYDFVPEKLGWDGSFRGQPMNPAVFVYVANVLFKDGVRAKFASDVTLIR